MLMALLVARRCRALRWIVGRSVVDHIFLVDTSKEWI